MKKSVDDEETPSPEQSQNRNIEDIKHEPTESSANMQLDDIKPGGSNPEKLSVKRSSISILNANKDNEYFHLAPTVAVIKNNEHAKSELAGTSKEISEDNEYFHLASTNTLVKNEEPVKSESAGTSKDISADNKYFHLASTDTLVKNEEPVKSESAGTSKDISADNEYFHFASTDTVVKNKKSMKLELAGTSKESSEDIEYFHFADKIIKNKEPVKSELAGTLEEETVVSPNPSITSMHSLEWNEEKSPGLSENEDSHTTSLREMFPDLPISDENLSLKRLQQMSTTDITREIVSLNKPAVLKPTVRLIPLDKMWLSPLEEVDKQQEAEAEKEIVQWERNLSNQRTDSESEEETEQTIDLEENGNAKD